MRKLVTIEKIVDVQPIEGADSIERVKVREWVCVSKKGEFKTGDLCVYFEIDSLVPSSNPIFDFLSKGTKEKVQIVDGKEYKGYRLKTIKLRGQISQGLALPFSLFPSFISGGKGFIGTDVTEDLGIIKYEPPIPANLTGLVKGDFPSFLNKTDEERIQNCSDILEKHKGEIFYVTEKLDGSSCTYYKKDGEFGVCSRNLDLKDSEGNTFWQLAHDMNLVELLPDNFSMQGEVVGTGIQGNPLKINGHRFFCFNVFDIANDRFLDKEDMVWFANNINISVVPILEESMELNKTVDEFLEYAKGKSVLNPESEREGIVVRPIKESKEIINGVESRLSFKVISNSYLLDYEQ